MELSKNHINSFNSKYVKLSCKCWIWIAALTGGGYGIMGVSSPSVAAAHRVSFFIHNGYLPDRPRIICHRCNNRSCVNPEHLYDGTESDNHLDYINIMPKPRKIKRLETVDDLFNPYND